MPPPIPRPLFARMAPRYIHHLTPQPHPPSPAQLLSTPTWSVRSLLPTTTKDTPQDTPTTSTNPTTTPPPTITPANLQHLLTLSSLPSPAPNSPQETHLLTTLHAQLHFVRAIQQVDTTDIKPLHTIRDETRAGLSEARIGLATPAIRDALAGEERVGRCARPRRRRASEEAAGSEGWDVLGQAGERVGRYFVVRSGSGKGGE